MQLRLVGKLPQLREVLRRRGLPRPYLRDGFRDDRSRLAGAPLPQVEVRHDAATIRLDDMLGYHFALISRPNVLTASDIDWSTSRRIRIFRLGTELVDADHRLERWMTDEALDFALVRPDRHLFAAGRSTEFERIRGEFDRWFV
jgi:hypothetical protein